MTENISKFVDYHSKDLVKSIPSHFDETPDFFRQIEDFKKTTGYIGDEVVPVSIDVTGLYPNIPINKGLLAFEEALDTRTKREESTNFLISLLQLVLTGNVVEFNKKNFLQIWGTSMGSGCSPSYADIFMAKLERGFLESLVPTMRKMILFYRRYLDDIFVLWRGTKAQFQSCMDLLNDFHHTIKFTFEGDFNLRRTTFLDVIITIQNGALDTDLYIKPTAACAYLSPFSCHPPFIVSNIPYSLAFRIRRICSLEADFNKRLDDLREVLLSRGYNKRSIEDSFGRVRLKFSH